MWDFLNQPLSGPSSMILLVILLAVIFAAIKLGHKKERDISRQFLEEHPSAATLYIYGEDLPSNSAELECRPLLRRRVPCQGFQRETYFPGCRVTPWRCLCAA